MPSPKAVMVSWDDVRSFARQVRDGCIAHKPVGVYGQPRGGLCLAVMLSHALDVPMLASPCRGCLVVDDICDSGKTLLHVREAYDDSVTIATMYFVSGALVTPDMWAFRKAPDSWVVFPWETV